MTYDVYTRGWRRWRKVAENLTIEAAVNLESKLHAEDDDTIVRFAESGNSPDWHGASAKPSTLK